jgi:hypothetical protein
MAGKLKPLDVERETAPGKYSDGCGSKNYGPKLRFEPVSSVIGRDPGRALTVSSDLLPGEYCNPARVIAFDTIEGWGAGR